MDDCNSLDDSTWSISAMPFCGSFFDTFFTHFCAIAIADMFIFMAIFSQLKVSKSFKLNAPGIGTPPMFVWLEQRSLGRLTPQTTAGCGSEDSPRTKSHRHYGILRHGYAIESIHSFVCVAFQIHWAVHWVKISFKPPKLCSKGTLRFEERSGSDWNFRYAGNIKVRLNIYIQAIWFCLWSWCK